MLLFLTPLTCRRKVQAVFSRSGPTAGLAEKGNTPLPNHKHYIAITADVKAKKVKRRLLLI